MCSSKKQLKLQYIIIVLNVHAAEPHLQKINCCLNSKGKFQTIQKQNFLKQRLEWDLNNDYAIVLCSSLLHIESLRPICGNKYEYQNFLKEQH